MSERTLRSLLVKKAFGPQVTCKPEMYDLISILFAEYDILLMAGQGTVAGMPKASGYIPYIYSIYISQICSMYFPLCVS